MNEDLIFYENEPKYKIKRQVNFHLELESGTTEGKQIKIEKKLN